MKGTNPSTSGRNRRPGGSDRHLYDAAPDPVVGSIGLAG
jgi:hypothetical protein